MQVKPKILTRFLIRRWLSGLFLVLLIVCGVIFSITFIEKMPSSATTGDALWTAWVLLLQYIPLFLPLGTFMGTLVATYNLTRSSESVIISGAGLSPYQSSRPFLIAAFFIGLFAMGVMNPYAVSVAHRDKSQEYIMLTDGAIWLRETRGGETFTLRATGMQHGADGALVFTNAQGFILDSESKFISRIESNAMTLSADGFSARRVTMFMPDGQPRIQTNWRLGSLMTPESVLERHLRPAQVSFWKLPGFIKNMNNMGLNSRGHRIQFWTLLLLPLTLISMATLGVAFSQTRQRRNFKFGPKFSAGILTCFILYFIINVFGALGTSGALPTLFAVLAPPLIVLFGAAIFIVSFDTI